MGLKAEILDSDKYTFDASTKTVTFTDLIDENKLLLITNITDNQIIYNFGCPKYKGTLSGRVLTLEYDTTLMSDGDTLQVTMNVDTDASDTITHDLLDTLRKQTEVQDEMLEQLQICAKYLKKIYNPE